MTIMEEHPNNQRNRDRARGCHATYHFFDGRSFRRSLLPMVSFNYAMDFGRTEKPTEVFWNDGKSFVVNENQKFFFGDDFVQPFHQLKFINLEEFTPVWDGDIPRMPE